MDENTLARIIENWIKGLEPKGNTAINVSNVKGFKMDNVKIKGFKTGVNVDNSSDLDFKNIDISAGHAQNLTQLLKDFKITLIETPNEKEKLTNIFDKIYSTCGTIQGILPIINTLSRFLGLSS